MESPLKMARKTAQQAEYIRLAILDAGLKVFARDGFYATSLDTIAKEAYVSRGEIYWHYSGKFSLLSEIFSTSVLPLENFADPKETLEENLTRLKSAAINTKSNHHAHLLSTLIYSNSDALPIIVDRRKVSLSRFDQQTSLILQKAKDCGQVKPEMDIKKVVRWLHCCLIGIIMEGIDQIHIAEAVEATILLFKQWITPRSNSEPPLLFKSHRQ